MTDTSKDKTPAIKGSFIQYYSFVRYSDKALEQHFDYLSQAGIEFLVLFTSAFQNLDGTFSTVYYPSKIAAANKGSNYNDTHKNITKRMLDECKKHNIKAYISPTYNDHGWGKFGVSDREWVKEFSTTSVKVARELHDLYKAEYGDIFYGWYFVPEFANYFARYTDENFDNAILLLNTFVEGINGIDSTMPFLISPYFSIKPPYSNAADTAEAWRRILSGINFRKGDIFCPQDCVGSGLSTIDTFEEYYAEFKAVVDKQDNLSFWGNPENFKQSNWSAAPITRFATQLQIAAPYVEGFISFAYSHYYAPDIKKTQYFHDSYLEYIKTGEIIYFSDNESAVPIDLILTPLDRGVEIKATFNNCKYGISHIEVYREGVLMALVHTEDTNYSDKVQEYIFEDTGINDSGTYEYTVKAIDFLDEIRGEITAETELIIKEIEVGQLLSVEKPYITNYKGNNTYPDVTGKMLTDGIYATTDDFSDKNAIGFVGVRLVDIIIDLESEQEIGLVVPRALNSGSGGAAVSEIIEVSFSNNGISFTGAISVMATSYPMENGYTVVRIPTDVKARYIKVCYKGLKGWLFIDEIEIYEKNQQFE